MKLPAYLRLCLTLCGFVMSCVLSAGPASGQALEFSLATFRADVTPSVGEGPCVGFMRKIASIEHPLEMRGVLIQTPNGRCVIAAIDFCGICNTSDETIRDGMAKAAGTTRDRVALQSLHQHSAPVLDSDAVQLLHGDQSEQMKQHLQFTDEISLRAAKAIETSLRDLQPVTRVVATKAQVEQVASNRRVPQPDGSIAVRASVTSEVSVRDAPEGLIDPWLRTLTFYTGSRPLTQLHYYATHPQTFYGDARISWDCVGMAREKMEEKTGIFQVYFTGCGGNITVGKYNDGSRAAREQMTSRLLDAMLRSSAAPAETTVDVAKLNPAEIGWDSTAINFTKREDGAFHPKLLQQQLMIDQPFSARLTAAMFSAFGQRLHDGYTPHATRLRIGSIDVLHLPGEPFVEFQLFAQENSAAHSFVCVAGYGECGVWYYGPDTIFTDRGGYEQTWSVSGPCQKEVESALSQLLTR